MKITPELLTKAYTRGIQSALKGLATDGSDLHENYTPPVICDMMLDKLDLTQPKSILVLYNLELLFALRLRKYTGPVTFFTQSPTKAEIAPKFLPGVAVEYIDKEENPLYFMENKWPEKFDIVVANPPYSNKLDLKFLEKSLEISKNDVLFIHPSTVWISKEENKYFSSTRNKLLRFLKSIHIFNGNGAFGIGLYTPCSISYFSRQNEGGSVEFVDSLRKKSSVIQKEEVANISAQGLSKNFNTLYEKIYKNRNIEFCSSKGFIFSSGGNHHEKYLRNPNSFFVEMSNIRGNCDMTGSLSQSMYKEDFFTFLRKDSIVISGRNPKYQIWFEFATENEANNFLGYLKTDFARMCLSLVKRDQHIKFTSLPWLDFTQEWTDEKLYAHFNITEEEQAFIKEVIQPYYD